MGAEVTAISHSPKKKEDALKMGASHFISTAEDPKWAEGFAQKNPFDLIINTASSNAVDVPALLSTLSVHGKLVSVGMPEEALSAMKVSILTLETSRRRERERNGGERLDVASLLFSPLSLPLFLILLYAKCLFILSGNFPFISLPGPSLRHEWMFLGIFPHRIQEGSHSNVEVGRREEHQAMGRDHANE